MIITLFLLRLISVLLLIGFVSLLFYLMARDMLVTERSIEYKEKPLGQLVVTTSESSDLLPGTQFHLKAVTSLGRGIGNLVVLPDTFASTEHALILRRGPRWWIEDLGSSNGTLLNDEPLSGPTVITSGDIVMIGSTQLRVDLEPATITNNGQFG